MGKEQQNPVHQLFARIDQKKEVSARQKHQLDANENENGSASSTDPYTRKPPTDSATTSDGRPDAAEVFRLKKELELAKDRMARMDLELTQSRITRHTVEEAIGSPFPAAQHLAFNMAGAGMPMHENSFRGRVSPLPSMNFPIRGPHTGLRIHTGAPSMDSYAPETSVLLAIVVRIAILADHS